MFSYRINDTLSLVLVHDTFAQEVADLVNRQTDYLGVWLPWVQGYNEDSYRHFANFALRRYADNEALHTHIVHEGRIVGAVSLNEIYYQLKKAEIGYWLSQDYQGRGIMTQAVKAIMTIAKDNYAMAVVNIKAAEHNLPSRKVAERLGFSFDGIIANNELVNGKILNHALYTYRFDG